MTGPPPPPRRGPWTIRRVLAHEGLPIRALRLKALADAPEAFSATLGEEAALAEDVWHARAARGAAGDDQVTYVGEDGDRWIGMATGLAASPGAPGPLLVAMFVEPEKRGQGVGTALVEAVVGWARARGAARLYLWVAEPNAPARVLYHRCGFRPTGRTKALPHSPSVADLEMVLDLEGSERAGTAGSDPAPYSGDQRGAAPKRPSAMPTW